ncbi:MAG: DNA translocase FtsK 4TM domain-containing protein [Ilumatobacter sp.]|uniref:FtsK/SpoIIIE family DNA translocase n=1 Tax=Ilumatobacter sp. TaxID=1967498 RepID=UPI00260CD33A|nr:DNA translocase FtsK [Ilumatobacter sp.]MDJ0770160.1 DNA translocase FtsK 4TM domain-containing protein [Ilumatobacter sp.]
MSTWGASKKPRGKGSPRAGARPKGSVRDQTPPKGSRGSSARGGAPRSGTPARGQPRRRDQASAELRQAVEGREHEFIGLVLLGLGVLLGLAIYFDLAGPLGRGVEAFVGWFLGLGRFALPVVLVSSGVALVKKGQSSSPTRLVIGWGLISAAVLGMLHIVRTPDSLTTLDDEPGVRTIGEAGGWIGAAIAGPMRALVASGGAVVVLVALFLGGVLLITQTSLRTMAMHTGRGVGSVARPLGRAAKKAISDLSTLTSERDHEARRRRGDDVDGAEAPAVPDLHGEPPALYDGAADDDDLFATRKPATKRRKRKPVGDQPVLPIDGEHVGEWVLPPLSHLKQAGQQAINMAEIERRGQTLQESLASHGVETELIGMTVGPTVTRYELELGAGVKVAKLTALQKDIAYAMAAVDVRILAPIPGRSAIGVEVPNHHRQLVALGDLMVSPEAGEATHPLQVAVGKDIAGKAVFLDISTTPHMLIAGATGAGKSSGINCIITSLLMRTTPDQVRLILIDPKQVEMGQYQRLPHLLTQPVTNPKKAANALGWAVKEMERRYDVLSEVGFRDITGYNQAFDRGDIEPPPGVDPAESPYEHMPYIVVVVDELNDLMMVAARDVEESITRIAQKARAVGIHLIVATQRPSVNVITGVIKANVPARMAFAVSSLTDSRVILDQPGAEKLVGKGDMLLLPGNSSVPNRIQGSFVSEEEVRKVVAHWRQQAPEPVYTTNVEGDDTGASPAPAAAQMAIGDDALDVTSDANAFSAGEEDEDAVMMRQAMELVVRSQLGSTSMLQRKLKVGFARAGRIMDLLEQRGVVGPSEGSKAREVLMTVEEFELLQQSGKL